ncbi:MAG: thioredoxin domain-containing protein [Gemmatimonadota bacterium]|jgi:protein-disulfide isomerase
MMIHPAIRLAVPAGLFVVFATAPSPRPAGAGDGPDPVMGAAGAPVPDVPLAELYHELAAPSAQATVVEFSDFGCPYCGQFERNTFPALRKEFVETGKVRWRFVPFVLGMFPNGSEAMRASTCVAEQGEDAFWKMHDALFARQDEWKGSRDPEGLFRSYAEASGADGAAFAACYDDARSADRVTAANALAEKTGVRSTPTFFINGKMVQGALPLEQFRQILQDVTR